VIAKTIWPTGLGVKAPFIEVHGMSRGRKRWPVEEIRRTPLPSNKKKKGKESSP